MKPRIYRPPTWSLMMARHRPGDGWRMCHAQSARKHRRQGHDVKFSHWSANGHCVYLWRPDPRRGMTLSEWVDTMLGRPYEPDFASRPYQEAMIERLASGRLTSLPPKVIHITTPKGTETFPWGGRDR